MTMSCQPIEAQICEVFKQHPNLTRSGFAPEATVRGGYAESDMLTPEGVAFGEQVSVCLGYLALVRKTRTARPKKGSAICTSYSMKHEVEAWLRRDGRDAYVPHGAFLVASIIAEVPLFRENLRSKGRYVGIDPDDVRAIQKGKIPAEWNKTAPFVKWLFKQAGREDPVGDLGGDCKADWDFPRRGNIKEIRSYLSQYGYHVTGALEEAIKERRRR